MWIEGPAGAGKTTLIVNWLTERRRAVLWYQVDSGDRDPASFFHYLGIAVAQATPRYRTSLPKLTPEYLGALPVFTRNFFRELARRLKRPFVLVFDNLQEIGAESVLHEILSTGLEELPHGSLALLLSRSAPPETFARAHLAQRFARLGGEALRLREDEAVALVELLAARGAPAVSAEDAKRLCQQCDGWFAGMLLLLQSGSAGGARVAALDAAGAQALFDYFAAEVFNRRHPIVKELLMQTAIFAGFTAEMAERLTGNREARAILDTLVRMHHFTEHHAASPPIYQYHPLFRAFLLAQARSYWSPAERARLTHRAAVLLEQADNAEAALALYLESADWARAVGLLLAQAEAFIAAGRYQTLADLLARLPQAILEAEPWLRYWRAQSRLPFALEEARGDLEQGYRAFRARQDATGLYLSWAAIIDSYVLKWLTLLPADKWIDEFQLLRAQYPEFPSPEVEARVTVAAASILSHRYLNHAELPVWLERGGRLVRSITDDNLRGHLAAVLLLCHLWLGHMDEVTRLIQDVDPRMERTRANPFVRAAWCAVVSVYEWHMGEVERSLALVEQGRALLENHGIILWRDQTLSQGVYASLVDGDVARANHYLEVMRGNEREGIELGHYHHITAMVAVHREDLDSASVHAELGHKLTDETRMYVGHLLTLYLCGIVAFLRGDTRRSKDQLASVRAIAESKSSPIMLHRCRMAEAALTLEEGEREAGLAILREALALSRQLRGPALPWLPRPLLGQLYATALAEGIEVGHVQALIRRFGLPPPPAGPVPDTWPYPVKIYTLGRFAVMCGGEPLTFSTKAQKKPLELLKALIALGGKRVDEEKLAEALWPDAEADAALHALGSTLYRLRKLIGEGAVVRQEGHLSLEPRQTWIDLWVVEHLVARLAEACAAHRPDEVAFLVDKTLKLYVGPFLESEPNAAWALSARERLRARLLRHLEAGARCLVVHAQHERAIECYQRALEIEPLAEMLHRGLMQSYVASGRHAEAVTAYERCRRLLRQELGVDASPETDALAQSIKTS